MEKIKVTVDKDLEDIIPEFMQMTAADVAAMRKLLTENDLAGIKRTGHSLKGAGAGYGFGRITEIGRAIEEKAASGSADGISDLIDELDSYLSRVEITYS